MFCTKIRLTYLRGFPSQAACSTSSMFFQISICHSSHARRNRKRLGVKYRNKARVSLGCGKNVVRFTLPTTML